MKTLKTARERERNAQVSAQAIKERRSNSPSRWRPSLGGLVTPRLPRVPFWRRRYQEGGKEAQEGPGEGDQRREEANQDLVVTAQPCRVSRGCDRQKTGVSPADIDRREAVGIPEREKRGVPHPSQDHEGDPRRRP